MPRLATLLAQFLLKQFSKGLVRALGGRLVTGNAADQIGHVVIKPVRQDGVRMLGKGIADYARLGDARQSRGLPQPCFSSSVKANAFHGRSVSRVSHKRYYIALTKAWAAFAKSTQVARPGLIEIHCFMMRP